jgi:hypothetical protein
MSDLDPLETREWLDALNSGVFERRSGDVPARRTAQWRPPQRRAGMVLSQYPLSEHVHRCASPTPRSSSDRIQDPIADPVEK